MTAPTVILTVSNDLTLDQEGWVLLAPYGDADNVAVLENVDSFRATFPTVPVDARGCVAVVQRITAENAARLAEQFNSVLGRVKRFFRGSPIFLGHPDSPVNGSRYPDKSEKGLMQRLEARPGGLYGLPVFNSAGADLINGGEKLFFSVRLSGQPTGADAGRLVYEPTAYISAGLTPHPNLSSELLNTVPLMDRIKLIAALAALGVTLDNTATDDAILAALSGLAPKLQGAATLANEKATLAGELSTLKVQVDALTTDKTKLTGDLANEVKLHHTALVNGAITDGRITAGEREVWLRRLAADFANESPVLARLTPKVKVANLPAPEATVENASPEGFKATVDRLVAGGKPKGSAVQEAIRLNQPGYVAWRNADQKPEI